VQSTLVEVRSAPRLEDVEIFVTIVALAWARGLHDRRADAPHSNVLTFGAAGFTAGRIARGFFGLPLRRRVAVGNGSVSSPLPSAAWAAAT
jgi:hypothetical protein